MTEIIIMAGILGLTFGMGMFMGTRIERQRRRKRRNDYYVYGTLQRASNPDPQFDVENYK